MKSDQALANYGTESQSPVPKAKYPRSVPFIISNEFCERFTYYGSKTILVLYFTQIIGYNEDVATEYYHAYSSLSYFTPLIGAIIADTYLGKYKTIFSLSILYAIGNIVLSYSAVAEKSWIMWIGLASIALGTGGIKPCVSAFGGDQFGPGQEKQLAKFFSFFYMAINAGGLLSMFFTPMMREDVQCFGRTTCYPLAFGVPALLMLVALALFVSGRYLTTYVFVPPQKESVVVQVVKCVFISLLRKLFKKLPKRDHWLDYADDKYDKQTIEDIKAVMRVLFLYIPIPLFFALFNQTGSRWTLQAVKMVGKIGSFTIKPDQIGVVNTILVLLFIPVFNYAIYPLLGKFGMLKKPLQRIVVGGVLAGISFAICGFFQLSIENQLPPVISGHSIHVSIVNGLNSEIKVKNSLLFPSESLTLEKYNVFTLNNVNIDELTSNGLTFNITLNDVTNIPGCLPNRDYFLKLSPGFQRSGLLFITESICELTNELKILEFDQELNLLAKPANGGALAAIAYNIRDSVSKPVLNIKNDAYITFKLNNSAFTEYFNSTTNDGHPIITGDTKRYVGYVPYKKELNVHKGGNYELLLLENDQDNLAHSATNGIELLQGGAYVSIIYTDENGKLAGVTHNLVKPNTLSVLMQIIPYAIITFGEIMLQVTGLEFSYSQAPASMKSLVGAAWYLTVAFGDLIVIIISSAKLFDDLSNEFFFFAGLMVADMIVFAIIAYFYQPYKGTTDDGDKVNDPNKMNARNSINTNELNGNN